MPHLLWSMVFHYMKKYIILTLMNTKRFVLKHNIKGFKNVAMSALIHSLSRSRTKMFLWVLHWQWKLLCNRPFFPHCYKCVLFKIRLKIIKTASLRYHLSWWAYNNKAGKMSLQSNVRHQKSGKTRFKPFKNYIWSRHFHIFGQLFVNIS